MKKKKLPKSYIVCCKCETRKKTTKPQLEKLIGAFGSLEDVHTKYHCIECRRTYNVRKDGKPKPVRVKREKKKDPFVDENGNKIVPSWMKPEREHSLAYEKGFRCPKGVDPEEYKRVLLEVAREFFAKRDGNDTKTK